MRCGGDALWMGCGRWGWSVSSFCFSRQQRPLTQVVSCALVVHQSEANSPMPALTQAACVRGVLLAVQAPSLPASCALGPPGACVMRAAAGAA